MKITNNIRKAELEFDAIVKDLLSKHEVIFFADIDDITYIYRPLTRKEYKTIVENDNLNILDKEDEVCEATILWPKNLDFDDVSAGVPSILYQKIIEDSFLDGVNKIISLIETYRQDLVTVDAQMSCIISEAFPNIDIEEIESWDMIKFCKMFSRAEWKLKNFRNIDNLLDVTEILSSYNEEEDNEEYEDEEYDNELQEEIESTPIKENKKGTIKVGNKEMTEDEYQQYLNFQKAFPIIDFGADTMFTGFDTLTADTTPVALRTIKK